MSHPSHLREHEILIVGEDANGGPTIIFHGARQTQEACDSMERGEPNEEVKEWARQMVRITKDGGEIRVTDGTRLIVQRAKQRLLAIEVGPLFDLHQLAFGSIGWRVVDAQVSLN